MNIRKKFLSMIAVFSIIHFILITMAVNMVFKYEVNNKTQKNVLLLSSSFNETISNFFGQKIINIESIADIPYVIDFMERCEIVEGYAENNDAERKFVREILKAYADHDSYIISVDLVDLKGKIVASSNEKNLRKPSLLFEETSLDPHMEGGQIISHAVSSSGSYGKADYFIMGNPIMKDKVFYGYVTMRVNLEYFQKVSVESTAYNMGYISIVDGDGHCVTTGNSTKIQHLSEFKTDNGKSLLELLTEADFLQKGDDAFSYTFEGIDYRAYYHRIKATDWMTLTSLRVGYFTDISQSSKDAMTVVLVLIGAFNFVAYMYFSRRVSDPLKSIIDTVDKLNAGENKVRFDEEQECEFAEIAKAFNTLLDNNKSNISTLKRLNAEFYIMTSNLPGGMIRFSADEVGEVDFVSESYLKLIECDSEDFHKLYHAEFFNTIYPPDVDTVRRRLFATQKGVSDFEYRIEKKDKSFLWVRQRTSFVEDEKSRKWFYAIIVDISRDVASREAYRKIEERYLRIVSWTEDIVFEWDKMKDTLVFSSNVEKKLGYLPLKIAAGGAALVPCGIHAEDEEKFDEIVKKVSYMISGCQTELRFKKMPDNTYIWHRLKMEAVLGANGEIIKFMGILSNINYQKNEEFIVKGQRDELSGFFTAQGLQIELDKYLLNGMQKENGALLMLSIDGYLEMKQQVGEAFLDVVLGDVAQKIENIFKKEDIIAKTGNDQFSIYVKSIHNREALSRLLTDLMDTMRGTYSNENGECRVSCCIGAALYPASGQSYAKLHESARHALTSATGKGKGKFSVFNGYLS